MEDGNPSALTPMAGKVSKLQEDCDSDRSTRDGLGLLRWRLPLQFILALRGSAKGRGRS